MTGRNIIPGPKSGKFYIGQQQQHLLTNSANRVTHGVTLYSPGTGECPYEPVQACMDMLPRVVFDIFEYIKYSAYARENKLG